MGCERRHPVSRIVADLAQKREGVNPALRPAVDRLLERWRGDDMAFSAERRPSSERVIQPESRRFVLLERDGRPIGSQPARNAGRSVIAADQIELEIPLRLVLELGPAKLPGDADENTR